MIKTNVLGKVIASIALTAAFLGFQFGLFEISSVFFASILFNTIFLYPRIGIVLGGSIAFLIQSVVVLFFGIIGVQTTLQYSQIIVWSLFVSSLTVAAIVSKWPKSDNSIDHLWKKEQWAAFTGPLFFAISFGASKILPGGILYAWVMNNDAVNNILMVRDLVKDGGILLGEGGNPVPFTTSMLSLFLAKPDIDYSSHGNLQHDVIGMEFFWFLTAIVLGLAAGLLAAELFRRNTKSRKWAIGAAAVTSLATNMWFIIGYPIEYGFLNAALGLALLLIAVLIFQFYEEYPAAVLGGLFLSSILVLATWTPTILFIAGLVLVVVLTQRKHIFTKNLGTILTWAIPLLLVFIFLFWVTIPSFIRTSSLLSAQGAVEAFPKAFLFILPIAIVLLSNMAFGLKSPTGWAISAIGLSQIVAVSALLFLNRSLADPWTYYPFKMLWFGSALIALLSIPLAFIVASRFKRKVVRIGTASFITFVVFLCFNWSIPNPTTFMFKGTTGILFAKPGDIYNDKVAKQMFIDDQKGLVVYWNSSLGDEASALNFWNISNWANSLKENVYDLRFLAYYLPQDDPTALCKLSTLAKTDITVVTEVKELGQIIHEICPNREMNFLPN